MQHSLVVSIDGQASRVVALRPQLLRIGSDPRCEIPIAHPEVADQAATLDCSGGGYLICNLNPFNIYLGSRLLEPQQWSDWSPGEQLHLTLNVTLALQAAEGPGGAVNAAGGKPGAGEALLAAAGGADEKSADSGKTMKQMLIIGACLVLGVWMLLQDNSKTRKNQESAPQLIQELQQQAAALAQPDPDYDSVVRLLHAAWLSESRGDAADPEPAVEDYATLLQHARIQKAAPHGSEQLFYRIRIFAGEKIQALQTRVSQ